MLILLAAAAFGFTRLGDAFFPETTRAQFQIDVWLPEGTQIYETERTIQQIEDYIRTLDHVTDIASAIGRGMPRFLLSYTPKSLNASYAYLLVSVDDYQHINSLKQQLQTDLETRFSDIVPVVYKFNFGPGHFAATPIEARFNGPDKKVLRKLAEQAMTIMHEDGGIVGIQHDWRGMAKAYRPILNEVPAQNLGIDRRAVANVLASAFDGSTVGVYRENDELIPIVARAPQNERINGLSEIQNLWIWSPIAGQNIPLQQVMLGYKTFFEDGQIRRFDRKRAITVLGAPATEMASTALARIRPQIEAIELPIGYSLKWAGEIKDSRESLESVLVPFPMFMVLMLLITIFLFNALRPALIIWLCVPLAIIGVVSGLLVADQPLNFVAVLGLLSLTGMLIKNAIVLLDQIELEIQSGKSRFEAIVDSGVSRARPVMMAAMTTVLGMIPLVFDAFFAAMAVTIMTGLTFAAVLTLVVVPVLYSLFYHVKPNERTLKPEKKTLAAVSNYQ
ncbi:acriflavin resistance protein [Candidatus Vecturithrix granuli]|uniref:Acriflavin resistance protein n=1 Tax=Vecturithrix granuli TaxID=1499967 RepID=A0A081C1S1_VECG1|nr:acriflavin resistance protein [Candidatus Vecturithrix granuli]